MKVLGLDGCEYTLRVAGHVPRGDDERPRSSYHLAARELLHRVYPVDTIAEEVALPGCATALYADFFLPLRRLMIEVQGEQHFRWIQHWQISKMDFLWAKGRDLQKRRWCEVNQFALVELPFHETVEQWHERLQ
jgi:hypothetical protein